MAVRRDPRNGLWRYQKVVRLPDGSKQRISGTPSLNTKAAAEDAERAHIGRLIDPRLARKETPRFKEFVERRWLRTYPASVGNRPSSVKEKTLHVERYLTPELGRLTLDRIQGEAVSRLFAKLRRKRDEGGCSLSEKTIKNVRATLRRILASAVEWGDLEKIPMLPKVKVPDAEWDFFTKAESDQLIATARDDEERALLLFAVHTGARAGEQLAFEWGDIDWSNDLVVFRRASKDGVVGPTKSGKERKVALTGELKAALKKMRHLRSKLVFCRDDGSPMSIDQLHERLWRACRQAGLRRIRWHDLRHSFASQLVIGGVPLLQVKEWLGHSTVTMTMRYAHLAPGGGREHISVLEHGCRANSVQTETESATETE